MTTATVSIQWETSLEQALQRAAETGKAVLVDFTAAPE